MTIGRDQTAHRFASFDVRAQLAMCLVTDIQRVV